MEDFAWFEIHENRTEHMMACHIEAWFVGSIRHFYGSYK